MLDAPEAVFSRKILRSLQAPGMRFDLLVDEYPSGDERLIHNGRHSVAYCLSGATESAAWLEAAESEGSALGQLVFVPADVPLVMRGRGGSIHMARMEFEAACFPIVSEMLRVVQPCSLGALVDMQSSAVTRLLNELAREAQAPDLGSDVVLQGFGGLIAAEIARHLRNIDRGEPHFRLDPALARQFVEANLARRITLKEIAAIYGLSERHLSRMFRLSCGASVHRFIETIRMEHARRLLVETALPLKQIAYELGYSDQAAFSVAFSRATRMSPSSFRRRPA